MNVVKLKKGENPLVERLLAVGSLPVRETDCEVSNGEWLALQLRMHPENGGSSDNSSASRRSER